MFVESNPLARQSKNQFAEQFFDKNLDNDSERLNIGDLEFVRNPTGSNKGLYDPERASPFLNPVVRRNKRLQDPIHTVSQSPMACVDARAHQLQPTVHGPVGSDPQKTYGLDQDSILRGSGQHESKIAPRDQPIVSPSSQGFDLFFCFETTTCVL